MPMLKGMKIKYGHAMTAKEMEKRMSSGKMMMGGSMPKRKKRKKRKGY